MVDSRKKGARAELAARDLMRKHTGLKWERTPGSGALNAVHRLKGDLYVPNQNNKYLIEVKHYKADQLGSNTLVNKDPTLFGWWDKACKQAQETKKEPIVMYKWDRSKWYIIHNYTITEDIPYIEIFTGANSGIIHAYEPFMSTIGADIKWI